MAGSSQNNVDFDTLLDLTEYDNAQYQSPSLSPTSSSKPTFASPVSASVSTPSLSAASQTLSGPSHNYDMYQQQTGFVPGAIANTMAVNQTNNTGYQDFGSLDYLSTFNPETELFNFNTSPSQQTMTASDIDMTEFASPADSQQFFSTVNPSKIEQESAQVQTSHVGRLWPGAHSQAAAMAKAQQQQQQQQQRMAQQQVQRPQQKAKSKAPQPSDPIVEQKITQLLNSMRANPAPPPDSEGSPQNNLPRAKKDEEEMDEDERLLASEEGKKLSSKERRQLRNKVSARAFRSRRKEYITQLESEIATKVNENGELRAQNRALMDENKRLTDLTRMLLSSSSFSSFLDNLSSNPASIPAPPAQVKSEPQQQNQRQMPKDVNPYGSQPSQQQIGMAMIPEQTMDFSMFALDNNTFNFQPQVFMVDTSDIPAPIDTATLSGKTSNFVADSLHSEGKNELPQIERPVRSEEPAAEEVSDETQPEDEDDEDLALFNSQPVRPSVARAASIDAESFSDVDLFGGIDSEKMLARYDLVDASQDEASAALAMARVQRLSASLEPVMSRLEQLTLNL